MAPTADGCMDGANGSQGDVSTNSHDKNSGSGISETCKVLCPEELFRLENR